MSLYNNEFLAKLNVTHISRLATFASVSRTNDHINGRNGSLVQYSSGNRDKVILFFFGVFHQRNVKIHCKICCL